MNQRQHTTVLRHLKALEQGHIIDLQRVLVGHKHLDARDADGGQFGNFGHDGIGQVGDGDMEAVVDNRFVLGVALPGRHGVAQGAAFALHRKIDVGGGTAKGRRAMAGEEIVGAAHAPPGHVEMGVDINAAGQYIKPRGVDHMVGQRGVEVGADEGNGFAVNQQIGHIGVGCCYKGAVFDQCFHRVLFCEK